MVKLVSIIGRAPGVAHTSLCLLTSAGVDVDRVILVGNVPEALEEAASILAECPCPDGSLPGKPVETVRLSFPDVRSQADLSELGDTLCRVIERGDYVDITGGRKIMSAWAAIVAVNSGAHVVASIVPEEEWRRAVNASTPCGKTVKNARLLQLA